VIAERTTAALAAYKARGGLLGSRRPNGRPLSAEARARGAKTHRDAARAAYADIAGELRRQRDDGASLRELAAYLNASGRLTRSDKPWSTTQVWRVLQYS
jgi:DNA invertase Pin-like site-specific DNA recombinase